MDVYIGVLLVSFLKLGALPANKFASFPCIPHIIFIRKLPLFLNIHGKKKEKNLCLQTLEILYLQISVFNHTMTNGERFPGGQLVIRFNSIRLQINLLVHHAFWVLYLLKPSLCRVKAH
mmetsp:Transcript_35200/g.81405  ORF Transcript_35200/g.81405 Transcript_35200/m.81405 type:complete len:119 (-) Transcript_35200:6368-6724(-)